MDGQNGGYRPRTAGERTRPDSSDNGVRDWQRNTWFGPAPVNTNPFEEPEDAPELKATRSENVNEHRGDFWKAPGEARQNTTPIQQQKAEPGIQARAPQRVRTKRQPRVLRAAVILVLFITAVLLVLRFAVFSVKEIRVIGNSAIPAEEIIRISGIHRGDSIITLNEKAAENRITSDYRLLFRYIARDLPGTVTISVKEREPCCWLTYCGILYVMDKNRMVLYETEDPNSRPSELVEIKGLEVRSNTLVGQYVSLGNETQQSIFTELFMEMKVPGCTDKIADADISNTSSILLTTRNGFTVSMGDRKDIHAKLRSMIYVQEQLLEMGYTEGTINVSNPEIPIFSQ